MIKHLTKVFAIAVIIVMAISVIPFSSSAAVSTWDGTSASTSFGGGDGTKVTPYLIETAKELKFLANSVNAGEAYAQKFIKLTTDIDLAGNSWTPIGISTDYNFSGYFDGDGHTISGLSVESEEDFTGLFGRLDSATVANLTVSGSLVSGVKYVGGLAAYITNSSTVINCTTEIDKIAGETTGGIVGRSSAGEKSYIIGCINKSTIQSKGTGNSFTGGIVGVVGGGEVSYCLNEGNVSIDNAEIGTYRLAGGIIGCQGASSVAAYIENCVNIGNISTSPLLSKPNYYFAGGIVGRASHVEFGSVKNCISTGEVSIDWGEVPQNERLDGIAGGIYGQVYKLTNLDNNYTTSSVIVGTDYATSAIVSADNSKTLQLSEMSGNSAVVDLKLNADFWTAMTSDIPSINFTAVYAEFLADQEPPAQTTVPNDETTATPDVTTEPIATTVPVITEADTTEAEANNTTKAPTTTQEVKKSGCGKSSVILAVAQFVFVAGGAAILFTIKKK